MELNLEALKKAAQAATPGPWIADSALIGRKGTAAVKEPRAFDWICSLQVSNQPNWDIDATYIAAANPTVVLELIARLQRAEAEIQLRKESEAGNG